MSNQINKVLVTGSGGLVGSEVVEFYCSLGCDVFGIDNNYREVFFGKEGSVEWRVKQIQEKYPKNYHHFVGDIRNEYLPLKNKRFDLVVHTAAQPSHDWAVKAPRTDFTVNANGTLNLLELYRENFPEATFIFTSTNKVYGDQPNKLPYKRIGNRWTPKIGKIAKFGFDETLSIDNCLHSIFGASKVAADIMVQEYGKYFGLNTGVFRGGCLTGPNHSGVELHGFLSYLVKCVKTGKEYKIYGHEGLQVRDNIHSKDLVNAFHQYALNPKQGEVYNIGGGPFSNCSMKEAIKIAEKLTGNPAYTQYIDEARIGDHQWWISDTRKFKDQYSDWKQEYNIEMIIEDIVRNLHS